MTVARRGDETLLIYPVSLIADSNVSSEGLYYLRYVFADYYPEPFSIVGAILSYLWNSYGFDFSNSSTPLLRYSVMASAAIFQSKKDGGRVRFKYYEYLSHFHQGLLRAIKSNTVDETHLFALFFIIVSSRTYSSFDPSESESGYTYCNVFCAVMEQLIGQHEYPDRKQVWRLALSYLRRCSAYPPTDTVIVHDSEAQIQLMYFLDTQLPGNYTFDNMTVIPCQFSIPEIDKDSILHFWNVIDVILSVRTSFQLTYRNQITGHWPMEKETAFIQFLDAARSRSDGFQKFQYLDEVFEVRLLNLQVC